MTLRLLTFEGFQARQIRSRNGDIRPGRGGGGSAGRPEKDSELSDLVKALARATAREDHRRFTGEADAGDRGKPA